MYNKKLNRSDLITFLDKFKDLIMVNCYEDPNPIVRINVKINWLAFFLNYYAFTFNLIFRKK